jgi:hypothetical protein
VLTDCLEYGNDVGMAGTGGMKNVTGTRRAVAIVAVRPGTAPTK